MQFIIHACYMRLFFIQGHCAVSLCSVQNVNQKKQNQQRNIMSNCHCRHQIEISRFNSIENEREKKNNDRSTLSASVSRIHETKNMRRRYRQTKCQFAHAMNAFDRLANASVRLLMS